MTEKEFSEGEFDEFLEMGLKYDASKEHRVIVFCEDCDDLTTISTRTGVACGHRPSWMDEVSKWLKDGTAKRKS